MSFTPSAMIASFLNLFPKLPSLSSEYGRPLLCFVRTALCGAGNRYVLVQNPVDLQCDFSHGDLPQTLQMYPFPTIDISTNLEPTLLYGLNVRASLDCCRAVSCLQPHTQSQQTCVSPRIWAGTVPSSFGVMPPGNLETNLALQFFVVIDVKCHNSSSPFSVPKTW